MADLDLWTADSKLSNFADDTQSVIISDNEENLRYLAKREAQAVVDHFSANNLVNNANKAHFNRKACTKIKYYFKNWTGRGSQILLTII